MTGTRDAEDGGHAGHDGMRWLSWAQNVLGAAILIGFAGYLWVRRQHFLAMLEVGPLDLVLLALTTVATQIVVSSQSYVLFRASGVRIAFHDNFILSLATFFGNYLPMRMGTLARARYLKAVHGLRYARFGSISGIRVVLTVMATGAMGLAGTVYHGFAGGPLSYQLVGIFAALLLSPALAFVWRLPVRRSGVGPMLRIWYDFIEGFAALRRQPGVSLLVLLLIVLQYVGLTARFYVALRATSDPTPLLVIVMMAPLALLANFAAITPGALGLREAVMGYVTVTVGASFGTGVLTGTLDRAVLIAILAAVGGPSFLVVWARIRRATVAATAAEAAPDPGA